MAYNGSPSLSPWPSVSPPTTTGYDTRYAEVMLLATLVLWCISLVCCCLCCCSAANSYRGYRSRSVWHSRGTTGIVSRRNHDHDHENQDNDDKDDTDITSVTFMYRPSMALNIEESVITITCDSCSICLEDFELNDECRVFIKCKHVHHKDCIDFWLSQNNRCPLCRDSVRGVSIKASGDDIV